MKRKSKHLRYHSTFWASFFSLLSVGLLFTYIFFHFSIFNLKLSVLSEEDLSWFITLLGGMAWGWLALKVLRFTLPSMIGLERIRHWNIFKLVRCWLLISLSRWILVILYFLPLGLFISWAGPALELPRSILMSTVTPIVFLLAGFWVCLLVERLTPFLDQNYIYGHSSTENIYHWNIRKYFIGYLRRLGLDFDESLLDKVLFLPSKKDEVFIYGGGFAQPRIVVSSWLVKLAMGTLDEKETGLDWKDEPVHYMKGIVLPKRKKIVRKSKSWNWMSFPGYSILSKLRSKIESIREKRLEKKEFHSVHRQSIGMNASLLGFVQPSPIAQSVPLISNNPQDLSVVEELLTYHYAEFEKTDDDEEYDDTDPTDKDFLFGVILREFGRVQRQDPFISTLWMSFLIWKTHFPRILQNLVDENRNWFHKAFSIYPAIISDSFTALNFGHHHLVQYLYFKMTDRKGSFTTRADLGGLYLASREVLDETQTLPEPEQAVGLSEANYRNRLIWISQYFYRPLPVKYTTLPALISIILAGVIGTAFLFASLESALDYHPVYIERMEEQKKEIEENQKNELINKEKT